MHSRAPDHTAHHSAQCVIAAVTSLKSASGNAGDTKRGRQLGFALCDAFVFMSRRRLHSALAPDSFTILPSLTTSGADVLVVFLRRHRHRIGALVCSWSATSETQDLDDAPFSRSMIGFGVPRHGEEPEPAANAQSGTPASPPLATAETPTSACLRPTASARHFAGLDVLRSKDRGANVSRAVPAMIQ